MWNAGAIFWYSCAWISSGKKVAIWIGMVVEKACINEELDANAFCRVTPVFHWNMSP